MLSHCSQRSDSPLSRATQQVLLVCQLGQDAWLGGEMSGTLTIAVVVPVHAGHHTLAALCLGDALQRRERQSHRHALKPQAGGLVQGP